MFKRGQVTIFVIVAIVIVGVIALLYLLPQTRSFLPGSPAPEPTSFLRSCIQNDFKTVIEKIETQGGSVEPDNYYTYQGNRIQYLCYTNENYIPCVIQQPLLISHVQNEIKNNLEPNVKECYNQLVQEYERRGFSVTSSSPNINVSIIPGKIVFNLNAPFSVTKDQTQTYNSLSISQNSQLYDLLAIATSIVQFESTFGDSETSLYIQYYPDLKVEKMRIEGDKVYTLSNVVTKDSFSFATRSLVWPPGYGGEQ